jgi:hypothetical protein
LSPRSAIEAQNIPDSGLAGEVITQKFKSINGEDAEKFYGNAVPYKRKDGTIGYVQLGTKGTVKPADLEDGSEYLSPYGRRRHVRQPAIDSPQHAALRPLVAIADVVALRVDGCRLRLGRRS